ncbi:hypothetical protein V5735_15775 (plasmid) [Haladaptatus sp. SPP-AMP-3]|uniref:DUF7344 domain-containing protein n=1 Tax=Haladaptatus sp. SPP-AMP-3 TaxID=3121295 RepID=UPI003C2C413C
MVEAPNDRRRTEATASVNRPTTVSDTVESLGLRVLLHIPPEIHDVLAAEPRQEIVGYLYRIEREVAIGELADYLAAADSEFDRQRVKTNLYHTHLPKLDAAEFIRWNRESGTVRLVR